MQEDYHNDVEVSAGFIKCIRRGYHRLVIRLFMAHIPGTGHANRTRSLIKTLSWRTIGTLDTVLIAFIITGNLAAGAAIGATELFTKMFLYYFHERAWSWSDWGLEDIPEGSVTNLQT